MPDDAAPTPASPRRLGRRRIAALVVVALLLPAAVIVLSPDPRPHWDGGQWGADEVIPTSGRELWIPFPVEYGGTLYLFSPALSHGTFEEHGVSPDARYDAVYRTFDGDTMSGPQLLTDPDDEWSESVSDTAVFEGKLFVTTTRFGPGVDSWNRSVMLVRSFDGHGWTDYPPLRGEAPGIGGVVPYAILVAWGGKLWAFWKELGDTEAALLRARAMENGSWSDELQLPVRGERTGYFSFSADDLGVWVSWYSNATDPAGERGIHLGRFNGAAIEHVARVTDGEGEYPDLAPMVPFQSRLAILWDAGGTVRMRTWDGARLSDREDVMEGYSPYPALYGGRLYVAAHTGYEFPSARTQWSLISTDGKGWGAPFEWTTSRYAFENPVPFVFAGRLYMHWLDGEPGAFEAHLRSYER